MVGITQELNQILESLDQKGINDLTLGRYKAAVTKILEREPGNPLALFVKARLLLRSTRPVQHQTIKGEILNLAEEMAVNGHSGVYYYRKLCLLNDLKIRDDDVYEEQKNACENILKTSRNPQSEIYHTMAERFLKSQEQDPEKRKQKDLEEQRKREEEQRNREEDEQRNREEDEQRKREDEQRKREDEQRKREDEQRKRDQEGQRKREEEQRKRDPEGQRKRDQDEQKKQDQGERDHPVVSKPDQDGVYKKAIEEMIKTYPEITDIILLGQQKKMRVKGHVLDAFWGDTPPEFHILLRCVEEDVPLVILENIREKSKLNATLETKKSILINKGSSSEYVEWAVDVWKEALIHACA